MNRPSIRSILDAAGASISFIDGLSLMGADLSALVPVKDAQPINSVYEGLLRVGSYARNNEKIQAIKELRTLFGFGLKESKDVVEAFIPPKPYPY